MRSWPYPYLPPISSTSDHPPLKLYDSYSKSPVTFVEKELSMYVCGITPYDATHLGHAATYITFDLIHRYLLAAGHHVSFVENITDIDDPLFERAKRDSIDWHELATSQIDLFVSDMTELRVIPPIRYMGVIESMPTIIDAVHKLVNKGLTYAIDGDIYLDLSQVEGALTNLPLSLTEAEAVFAERGGDPDRPGKRHSLDPLLWKAELPDEPSWTTPFGEGRPGWHIECVAIALANLPPMGSSSISIQGGGSDLKFPHHYMSACQSKALTGKEFSRSFIHAGMIGLDGEKMSKSLGNLVFVSKLIDAGRSPNAIRFALLARHYREDLMWSDEFLKEAELELERLTIALSKEEVAPTSEVITGMISALSNDLDTPRILLMLRDWVERTLNGDLGGESGELSRALDRYLGIAL